MLYVLPLFIGTLCSQTMLLKGQRKTLLPLIMVGQLQCIRVGDTIHMKDRTQGRTNSRTGQLGRICPVLSVGRTRASNSIPRVRPRVSSSTNDNQCAIQLKPLLLAGSPTEKTMNTIPHVKQNVVPSVHTAPGHSQKNEISPGAAGCQYKKSKLKSVKSVSCVIPLSYENPVTNDPNVALNLPVGARLQIFWKKWLDLGAGPKVVQILKEGYTLPFRTRPSLSRTPTVISCYGNPHRNLKLLRGITSAYGQKCHRISSQTDLTRVFQPTISSPKTRQQVETHFGPKQSKSFPQDRKIQDGDTGNHQDITPTGRMGNLHRLQGRLLPHSNTGTVQEILEIS